jgi:hypothetical protein
MHDVSWYGSAPVQVGLLFACAVGSVVVLVGWPLLWVVRKVRRQSPFHAVSRGTIVLGWFVQLGAFVLCAATLWVLRFLADATPMPYYHCLNAGPWIVAGLTLAIAGCAFLLVRAATRELRHRSLSRAGLCLQCVGAATACLWIAFFAYWACLPIALAS